MPPLSLAHHRHHIHTEFTTTWVWRYAVKGSCDSGRGGRLSNAGAGQPVWFTGVRLVNGTPIFCARASISLAHTNTRRKAASNGTGFHSQRKKETSRVKQRHGNRALEL